MRPSEVTWAEVGQAAYSLRVQCSSRLVGKTLVAYGLNGSKKCSKQVAAILPKVREVDEGMSPYLQNRIREAHPELCFAMMNGGKPMAFKKRKKSGQSERLSLLLRYFPDVNKNLNIVPGARVDVLDAYACLWTAQRIINKRAISFPKDAIQDAVGLRMEIVA